MIRYLVISLLVAAMHSVAATNGIAPSGTVKKSSPAKAVLNESSPTFWFAQAWRETEDIRKPDDRCDVLLLIGQSQVSVKDKEGLRGTAKRCEAAAAALDDARRIGTLSGLVPLMYNAGGVQEAQTALATLCTQAGEINSSEKQDELLESLGRMAILVKSSELALSLVDKIDSARHQADLCIALLDQLPSSNVESSADMTLERVQTGIESTKWKHEAGRLGLSLTNALLRCGRIVPEEKPQRPRETFVPDKQDRKNGRGNSRTNEVNDEVDHESKQDALRLQRYNEALQTAREAVARGSNEFVGAAEALEKAYRQLDRAKQPDAVKAMLRVYTDAGDVERAKQLLGRVDGPNDRADALMAIAQSLLGKGNKVQAQNAVNAASGEVRGMMKGLKSNEAAGIAGRYFDTLIRLWVQTGDWEQAMRLADLEAAAPSQKSHYRTISYMLASSGEPGAAKDMLGRVRETRLRIATMCGIAEGVARGK